MISPSPLSLEAQWLTGMALDPPRQRDVNWQKLLLLAQQEGATSVLWQTVRSMPDNTLPHDVASRLQKLAVIGEFQMLHIERALQDVLDRLASAGIEVMLLKGSALAYTVYQSFADRPMGDLDVLVRPQKAIDAWSLLQRSGWSWPATSWPADHYEAHQHLPPLVNRRGGDTVIEIHSALLPAGHPFQWPLEGVWGQAQQVSSAGRPVLVPHPLHQLLHVCVHFAWSHEMQWGSWRALRDVAAITRVQDVNWDEFVDLARQARAATCCFWTLRLARSLIGARVPVEVLRALRPPRPEFLLKRLEYHYLGQLFVTERDCPSETLNRALWQLGIAPRWSRHGAARPWHGATRWITPPATTSPRRSPGLLQQARHAVAALGYLGRITGAGGASRFPPHA